MPSGTKPAPGDLQQAVAAQLRGARGSLSLTNKEIADATGLLSRSQVGAILKGDKHVDVEQLDVLCYVLGLNLTDVVRNAEARAHDRQTSASWPATTLS